MLRSLCRFSAGDRISSFQHFCSTLSEAFASGLHHISNKRALPERVTRKGQLDVHASKTNDPLNVVWAEVHGSGLFVSATNRGRTVSGVIVCGQRDWHVQRLHYCL